MTTVTTNDSAPTISELIDYLDRHSIEWSINANPHRGYYETVDQHLKDKAGIWNDPEVYDADLAQSDTLVEVRAYPSNPVGFIETRAASLQDALFRLVNALRAD
jgi:hypothetical protein